MIIKGHHIKVIVNHSDHIPEQTVRDILKCVSTKTWFALFTKDDSAFVLFTPETLTAHCSDKKTIRETTVEGFIDTIKLTLYEYPVFRVQATEQRVTYNKIMITHKNPNYNNENTL